MWREKTGPSVSACVPPAPAEMYLSGTPTQLFVYGTYGTIMYRYRYLVLRSKYIMNQEWPECIKNWHRTKITFSVAEPQTMSDSLINVNKPWKPTKCLCADICKELKKREPTCSPCMIEDHLFIIGREYDGPLKQVLRTSPFCTR